MNRYEKKLMLDNILYSIINQYDVNTAYIMTLTYSAVPLIHQLQQEVVFCLSQIEYSQLNKVLYLFYNSRKK